MTTFVYTNFVSTNVTNGDMKIEEIIKSSPLTLSKQILMNIMFTQNILGEHINELLRTYDISPEQFNVLRILRGQKGNPANMGVIQERMIAKTSNTTRLVDKLLLKELVLRKVCPGNRRKMEITITQKGLDLLQVLDPVVEQHEMAFANNLNHKEQEMLVALLEKYRTIKT